MSSGLQGEILSFAGENLFQIDGEFGAVGSVWGRAEDAGVLRGGGAVEAGGQGEDLDEGLAALKLVNAGVLDGADDGDGLAAELGDGDGDFGFTDEGFEAFDELGFELFDGEAGSAEAAGHGEADVAGQVDAEGLVGDFFGVQSADGDLVFGAKDVSGAELLGGLGGWSRRRFLGAQSEGRAENGEQNCNGCARGDRHG